MAKDSPAIRKDDPKQALHDLKMVTRAIAEGWDVPFKARVRAIAAAQDLLESIDENLREKAVRLLLKADEVRLKAVEMMDKAERLDNETATEIVRFNPLTFGHTDK